METIQTTLIKMSRIEMNRGQIDGLPKNPRILHDSKFKNLVKSITDNPEMLALRELLVFPHGDKFVIIGGNMRYKAMKELGYTEAPCKIITADTPVETLKAYMIKDNGGFGDWDFDALTIDWDDEPLEEWGVDMPEYEAKPAEDGDLSDKIAPEYKIEIDCGSEQRQEQLFDELTKRGYVCRILTL